MSKPSNGLLTGKTVLVTGVGVGLGVETARSVLTAGGNVVIGARKADRIAATAAELDPTGDRVLAHPVDINDADSIDTFLTAASEKFGRIDALVQVAADESAFGNLHEASDEKWRRAMETNVLGALRVVRAVSKVMAADGGGSIVLIGSQSSFKPALPQPGYGASKGALLSAMYYWADELGPQNIRVNTVVPGWMWGPNVQMLVDHNASQAGRSQAEELAEMTKTYPMRRMAEDGDVADAVVFFASDLSRGVTGQHLMVNCGDMMG